MVPTTRSNPPPFVVNSQFQIINSSVRSEEFAGLCALGIMTKAPEPGKVKTRLSPPLTPAEAAALNECFLRDLSTSIELATGRAPATGVAIYTPVGKEAAYNNILPPSFKLLPQRGGSFDERLSAALSDLLSAGFESVCLINSDSPTVPASNFAEAANELAKPGDRIIVGPSDDGGYYLIGLKKLHRRIFDEIDWSTERVFEQTVQRAREINIPVYQLAFGYDVDDGTTLRRLAGELVGSSARNEIAPHTRHFLRELIEREGRDRIWPSA
jgi:uncharacterized protein